MHPLKTIPFLLVTFVFGCDTAVLKTPLADPDTVSRVASLDGVYKSIEPDPKRASWLHVGRAGRGFPAGFHRILWVPEIGDFGLVPIELIGFFVKIDDCYYLHLPSPEKSDKVEDPSQFKQFPKGWNPESVSHYSLFRVKSSDNGLVVQCLNAGYIISQIESNSLSGVVKSDEADAEDALPKTKSAVINATPSEFRAYIKSRSAEELFEKPIVFNRKG